MIFLTHRKPNICAGRKSDRYGISHDKVTTFFTHFRRRTSHLSLFSILTRSFEDAFIRLGPIKDLQLLLQKLSDVWIYSIQLCWRNRTSTKSHALWESSERPRRSFDNVVCRATTSWNGRLFNHSRTCLSAHTRSQWGLVMCIRPLFTPSTFPNTRDIL